MFDLFCLPLSHSLSIYLAEIHSKNTQNTDLLLFRPKVGDLINKATGDAIPIAAHQNLRLDAARLKQGASVGPDWKDMQLFIAKTKNT